MHETNNLFFHRESFRFSEPTLGLHCSWATRYVSETLEAVNHPANSVMFRDVSQGARSALNEPNTYLGAGGVTDASLLQGL